MDDSFTIQQLTGLDQPSQNRRKLADMLYQSKSNEHLQNQQMEKFHQQIDDLKDHIKTLTHINQQQQRQIDSIQQLRAEKDFWMTLAISQQQTLNEIKADNLIGEIKKYKIFVQKFLQDKEFQQQFMK